MELYVERGFDETTVAEIAKRAGLTERTFFRHFADKREVLFAGAAMLQDLFVGGGGGRARRTCAPVDAAMAGVVAGGALIQERRAFARQRYEIIAANAELQERELIKLGLAVGGTGRRACAGAASPTTRPAWPPRWRSPSSGSPSSAGSADPVHLDLPQLIGARHSTSSGR